MILYIDRDEVFPVYSLDKESYSQLGLKQVDLPEHDYAAYLEVCEAYEEWQSKLMKMWKEKES